jgi:ABC-2 type transport system ATP-binding protein
MNNFVIETIGLRKEYGAKVAVADLTLDVPKGEVFGFLGPNGSGKSTSVKMLLGLVAPTGGSAKILGQAPGHPQVMAKIGFLPEHFRFHEWMSAIELLDLHGRLYGMSAAARRERIPRMLELVGLDEHARRQIAGFSKGMLQRIGLAQALLNEPVLVFIDEPSSGLDPFGRFLVRGIIRDIKAQGTTVFLNSHLLSEVEATCDRVSFIRNGRVLRTLSLRDLEVGQLHVELRVEAAPPELLDALHELPGVRMAETGLHRASDMSHDGAAQTAVADAVTTLDLIVPDEDLLPQIAARVVGSGARLYALTPRRASLEQLFLEVVGSEDSGQ